MPFRYIPECAQLDQHNLALIHIRVDFAICLEVLDKGIPGFAPLIFLALADYKPDLVSHETVDLNGRTSKVGVRRGDSAGDRSQSPRECSHREWCGEQVTANGVSDLACLQVGGRLTAKGEYILGMDEGVPYWNNGLCKVVSGMGRVRAFKTQPFEPFEPSFSTV